MRGHSDAIKALAFSPAPVPPHQWEPRTPQARWLASGGSDRTIRLWPLGDGSAENGQAGRVLGGHDDEVNALAFSPDGDTLVSSSLDHTARLWSIDSGYGTQVLRGHPYALAGVVFSPDGQFVVTSSYDYSCIAWDVASGQRSERWRDHVISV